MRTIKFNSQKTKQETRVKINIVVFNFYFLGILALLKEPAIRDNYSVLAVIAFIVTVDWLFFTDKIKLFAHNKLTVFAFRYVITAISPAINLYVLFLVCRMVGMPIISSLLAATLIGVLISLLTLRRGWIFYEASLFRIFKKHLYLTLITFFLLGVFMWGLEWLTQKSRLINFNFEDFVYLFWILSGIASIFILLLFLYVIRNALKKKSKPM